MHTMICSAKAPTELRRVKKFSFDLDADKVSLKVGVFLQMQELHSIIM